MKINKSNIYAIKMSLFVFPIVAALFLIPYLIYQYRKHGSVLVFKAFVTYAFIYYLLTAAFLVMLPLYPRSFVAQMTGPYYDLQVFGFIKDLSDQGLLSISSRRDVLMLISNERFLEPFFNVLLTLPFGVFLRYYFKRQWWEVLGLSFLLSLTFEVTQLSGLYGFYSRPHRLFQIDDLMLNTLGGMIGYALTPLFVFMFPSKDELNEISNERKTMVGPIRRGLALLIDFSLILGFGIILFKYLFKNVSLITIAKDLPKYFRILVVSDVVYFGFILYFIIFFLVIPTVLNGSTIGKKIVKIKQVNNDDSELGFGRLIVSNLIIFIIGNIYYFGFLILFNKLPNTQMNNNYMVYMLMSVTIFLIAGTLYSIFVHKKTLHEVISKTKHVTY